MHPIHISFLPRELASLHIRHQRSLFTVSQLAMQTRHKVHTFRVQHIRLTVQVLSWNSPITQLAG